MFVIREWNPKVVVDPVEIYLYVLYCLYVKSAMAIIPIETRLPLVFVGCQICSDRKEKQKFFHREVIMIFLNLI